MSIMTGKKQVPHFFCSFKYIWTIYMNNIYEQFVHQKDTPPLSLVTPTVLKNVFCCIILYTISKNQKTMQQLGDCPAPRQHSLFDLHVSNYVNANCSSRKLWYTVHGDCTENRTIAPCRRKLWDIGDGFFAWKYIFSHHFYFYEMMWCTYT